MSDTFDHFGEALLSDAKRADAAEAEVERLRAVLRNLAPVVSSDYSWVYDAMLAAADLRWDDVPAAAKGEK